MIMPCIPSVLQVNNAGIAGKQVREVTRDGLELTMATNYYGHFLLTNLLLSEYFMLEHLAHTYTHT